MTDKPISPLRQRMIEDMTARHFAEKAQTDYIRYVKSFAAFLGRSPDTAGAEDLRLFQQHMTKTHVSPGVINATVVALRFFFKVTLERDDLVRRLTLVSEPRRVPIVLSPEEVARLLTAAPGVKYRAALGVAYGAGLRVSEVVVARVRQLLTPAAQSNPNEAADDPGEPDPPNPYPCPCCGGRMIVVETFGSAGPSSSRIRIDTS